METHAHLNNFDYLILSVVLIWGLFGLMRGFLREVLALVTWAIAAWVATKYPAVFEPWTQRYIRQEDIAHYAAIAAAFVVTFVALSIASMIIVKLIIRGKALTAANRSLGFLLGLGEGSIVVCILYLAAVTFLWQDLGKTDTDKKQVQLDAPVPTAIAPEEKQAQEKNLPAPEWVMRAKTRPYLAFGAEKLKVFVPQDEIDKLANQLTEQRHAAKKEIEDNAEDILDSTEQSAKKMASPFTEKGP